MKFRGSEVTTSGTSRPTSCSLHKSLGTSEASLDTEEAEAGAGEDSGMLELLATGDLADVDVVVGEKTFRCHKAILGAKSPFFKVDFFPVDKMKCQFLYCKLIFNNTDDDLMANNHFLICLLSRLSDSQIPAKTEIFLEASKLI